AMLYSGGELQIKIKMRVDVSSGSGSKRVMIFGPGSSSSYKLAELVIPYSSSGGATGFATFDFLFRANGSALVEMKYETSNVDCAVHKTATISSTIINNVRDKTQD